MNAKKKKLHATQKRGLVSNNVMPVGQGKAAMNLAPTALSGKNAKMCVVTAVTGSLATMYQGSATRAPTVTHYLLARIHVKLVSLERTV